MWCALQHFLGQNLRQFFYLSASRWCLLLVWLCTRISQIICFCCLPEFSRFSAKRWKPDAKWNFKTENENDINYWIMCCCSFFYAVLIFLLLLSCVTSWLQSFVLIMPIAHQIWIWAGQFIKEASVRDGFSLSPVLVMFELINFSSLLFRYSNVFINFSYELTNLCLSLFISWIIFGCHFVSFENAISFP